LKSRRCFEIRTQPS